MPVPFIAVVGLLLSTISAVHSVAPRFVAPPANAQFDYQIGGA